MCKCVNLITATIFALPFTNTLAEENNSSYVSVVEKLAEKDFSIGLGLYKSKISYDSNFANKDSFDGFGLRGEYFFNEHFAVLGQYYQLEKDNGAGYNVSKGVNSDNVDLSMIIGRNLNKVGLKFYFGAGVYFDKWADTTFNETFSGLQFTGGLGYNWNSFSLEYSFSLRDDGGYADFKTQDFDYWNTGATYISTTLSASMRF